ncbi:aldolase [Aspergillus pseudoustus]|uniref:Aldolase n=1 Tax=Aspergillus pseudoustus TaxID=1810923 RepID=A0ABR4JFI8_9EURO
MGSQRSLLQVLEDICNVDVDAVDPKVSTALPFKAHNQTSNQVICCDTMLKPEYRDMFLEKVKKYGSEGWEETVQFCADNLKNIRERVLVQVSPRHVYDTEAVLNQCHAYDTAFREAGVSRDRYAIKISVTGPSMVAAKKLNAEGIRILGTSVFSLAQAIAASQADCLFISPYFNEVAAYSDDSLMHKGDDPALTHPMAPRLIHILETYAKLYRETGKKQPVIVIASNANIGEVIATAELGCQHITILAHHLKELAETPLDATALAKYPILREPPAKKKSPYYDVQNTPARLSKHSTTDPMAGPEWDGTFASTEVDWLANNGAVLAKAMESDAAVVKKMKDVLGAFLGADAKAKKAIEEELAK